MELKDKTMVVTGGGNGMGRAITLNLLEKGCHVIAIDISEAALNETQALTKGFQSTFTQVALDITDRPSVERWFSSYSQAHKIDGLVNNAGIIQPFVKIEDIEIAVAQRLFNVNFWGAFNMIQILLPHLKTRPSAHIVNVSSMGGFLPIPGQSLYGASKASLKLLSESLSIELKQTKVQVTTAFPGALHTDIKKNSGLDDGITNKNINDKAQAQALSPIVAADILVKAIESDTPEVYIGNDSKKFNLLYKAAPQEAIRLITANIDHHL